MRRWDDKCPLHGSDDVSRAATGFGNIQAAASEVEWLEQTRNEWVQTYTGKAFYPLAPRVEDIDIIDIAHHLSNINRFTGATREGYNVAQHSVHVSEVAASMANADGIYGTEAMDIARAGLLHDASEAYLNDVAKPIKTKAIMGSYLELEDNIMRLVAERFGLDYALFENPRIKLADRVMLVTEKRDLLGPSPRPWVSSVLPRPETVVPLRSAQAKHRFLGRFSELFGLKEMS